MPSHYKSCVAICYFLLIFVVPFAHSVQPPPPPGSHRPHNQNSTNFAYDPRNASNATNVVAFQGGGFGRAQPQQWQNHLQNAEQQQFVVQQQQGAMAPPFYGNTHWMGTSNENRSGTSSGNTNNNFNPFKQPDKPAACAKYADKKRPLASEPFNPQPVPYVPNYVTNVPATGQYMPSQHNMLLPRPLPQMQQFAPPRIGTALLIHRIPTGPQQAGPQIYSPHPSQHENIYGTVPANYSASPAFSAYTSGQPHAPNAGQGSGSVHSTANVPAHHQQQQLTLPAPPLPDLLLPEPIPDLLTDSDASQQTLTADRNNQIASADTMNSLLDQMSIGEHKEPLKGTMEVYYEEIEQEMAEGSAKKRPIVWQIYRQRDNSGKYIKFRHVDKWSGVTEFSCVAPLPEPKKRLKLFFNNNQNVPFLFDASGYLISADNEFELDPFTGWPSGKAMEGRKYNFEEFQEWVGPVIETLLKDEKNPLPPASSETVPDKYPSEPVLQWIGKPLPVHPLFCVARPEKIGFAKLDLKREELPLPLNTDALDSLLEQMDDGNNWLKLEARQGDSGVTLVRDPNGQPPRIDRPMVLFFNGTRQYFDKTGTAISRAGAEAIRKEKEKERREREQWLALEDFLDINRAELQREHAEAEQKAAEEAAKLRAAYAPAPMKQFATGQPIIHHGQRTVAAHLPLHQRLPPPHSPLPHAIPRPYGYYNHPENRPLHNKWARKAPFERKEVKAFPTNWNNAKP